MCPFWVISEWLDLIRATRDVQTSHIGIAVLADIVQTKTPNRVDVAVVKCSSVPRFRPTPKMSVQENHNFWQVVVIIDEECQVCHSFTTFVEWRMEDPVHIIHVINGMLPAATICQFEREHVKSHPLLKFVTDPAHILAFDARYHDDFVLHLGPLSIPNRSDLDLMKIDRASQSGEAINKQAMPEISALRLMTGAGS
jgi:hypothetical protein